MTHIQDSTILLVDDNADNLNVLLDYLDSAGFRVLVAQNGYNAIQQLQYVLPDLILLDIRMPGIDGFETCRRLKTDERTKEIPVIFLTALSDIVDKINGFEAGGVDYITKPFQHEEVFARVNAHLTIVKQRQQLQALNAKKDKFFSILAHDLRSPYLAFLDFIRLFTEHIDRQSREEIKKIAYSARDTAENLYALLENLLTWSRFQ
ncbi:response regulator, partial [candidate division KSB3 bacterium]|nr:response regulator [candidate division KSB3 bacterium]MBD3324863.1 response regulator [candidate division KSB3 bacterium]